MSESFYLTTPIYYVNAEPHLGHAYTTILADVATRFHRLMGIESRLQTGTDEHGEKIAQAAEKEGIEPKAFTDRISARFQNTWPLLNIKPDNFIRTTDPSHVKVVQDILQKVYDAGDIYFAKYGGHYCVGCERFLTEHELVDGKCPDHGTEPELREEDNYFFRMTSYTEALKNHIAENPDFIRPERYRNEVLSILDQGLEDLCISRPKTRLSWGIELPFDDKFVTYVWFDALINYLTGLGWPEGGMFEKFWAGDEAHPNHLTAKDILKPHGIYWPTMLMALAKAEGRDIGYYLYEHLNIHGFWKIKADPAEDGEGSKMSKSLGNVVRPDAMVEKYGADPFRYFLVREMSFGLDAAFSLELLENRYNSDLANDLGNLFSRVLNMLQRYRGGVLPELHEDALTDADTDMIRNGFLGHVKGGSDQPAFIAEMEEFRFQRGLEAVWLSMGAANRYIVSREPWVLAKDDARAAELDNVLHILVQLLASMAHLIWPVMPSTAESMARTMGGELNLPVDWDKLFDLRLWKPGAKIGEVEALFPRLETKKVKAKSKKQEAKAEKPKQEKKKKKEKALPEGIISIDDFAKVQLRLGKVLEAGPLKGADKLLKLKVDLGEDEPRQIIAGIAQHYKPEELVGQQVVVVANLKPAKLRGEMSQGMVLACVGGDSVRVVSPDTEMPPGSVVR